MALATRVGAVLLLAALLPTATARNSPRVRKYNWRVTLDVAAPDCFERPVILVNGQLSPTIEVEQGDILQARGSLPWSLSGCACPSLPNPRLQASCFARYVQLTLHNLIPEDYPSVHRGITIHWHGWKMKGIPW